MGGEMIRKKYKWMVWDETGLPLEKGTGELDDLEGDLRRLKKLKLGL